MVVLLDLEWISDKGDHLTQLSAKRVDNDWNVQDSLDILVCPPEHCFAHSWHTAFGGLPEESFRNAVSLKQCIKGFASWLSKDDVIWVWGTDQRDRVEALWKQFRSSNLLPRVYPAKDKVRHIAVSGGFAPTEVGYLLRMRNISPPLPEHNASCAVEAMRLLFSALGVSISIMPKRKNLPVSPATMREIVAATIERSNYQYVYLKNSPVFHRKGCAAYLSCRGKENILGSIYYETAAADRRPCKLCNPVPPAPKEPVAVITPDNYSRGNPDDLLNVRLLTGAYIQIRRDRVLGWCRYQVHPGAVNKSLLEEHGCLEKNCFHFYRNLDSPFWAELEEEEKKKSKRKARKKALKIDQITREAEMKALADSWQKYLSDMGSDMYIVRVEKTAHQRYTVYYVSDDPGPDWDRHRDFLNKLECLYHHCRIRLQRIKDVDGSLVTTERYFSRRRK